jgi:hypothetical protein
VNLKFVKQQQLEDKQMAVGDITVFEEAKAYMIDGGWEAADSIEIQLVLATSTPTAADAAPTIASYNAATSTEGAQVLDTLTNMVTEAGGTMTFDDTGASVVWAQGGGNSTTVRWAVIYNQTATTPAVDPAICFIDLGSDRDLRAGRITITWNASGIFTII